MHRVTRLFRPVSAFHNNTTEKPQGRQLSPLRTSHTPDASASSSSVQRLPVQPRQERLQRHPALRRPHLGLPVLRVRHHHQRPRRRQRVAVPPGHRCHGLREHTLHLPRHVQPVQRLRQPRLVHACKPRGHRPERLRHSLIRGRRGVECVVAREQVDAVCARAARRHHQPLRRPHRTPLHVRRAAHRRRPQRVERQRARRRVAQALDASGGRAAAHKVLHQTAQAAHRQLLVEAEVVAALEHSSGGGLVAAHAEEREHARRLRALDDERAQTELPLNRPRQRSRLVQPVRLHEHRKAQRACTLRVGGRREGILPHELVRLVQERRSTRRRRVALPVDQARARRAAAPLDRRQRVEELTLAAALAGGVHGDDVPRAAGGRNVGHAHALHLSDPAERLPAREGRLLRQAALGGPLLGEGARRHLVVPPVHQQRDPLAALRGQAEVAVVPDLVVRGALERDVLALHRPRHRGRLRDAGHQAVEAVARERLVVHDGGTAAGREVRHGPPQGEGDAGGVALLESLLVLVEVGAADLPLRAAPAVHPHLRARHVGAGTLSLVEATDEVVQGVLFLAVLPRRPVVLGHPHGEAAFLSMSKQPQGFFLDSLHQVGGACVLIRSEKITDSISTFDRRSVAAARLRLRRRVGRSGGTPAEQRTHGQSVPHNHGCSTWVSLGKEANEVQIL
eukprot:Rhum_TRINITY_DN23303_c0_g1::Rhum_TRINITY_DN23303_c0_g1_i1::g.177662::m.177662